jgi:thiol-disulfide isomerase/thioredoxin
MNPRVFLSLLSFLAAVPALAQVYAPETEYHDISQRLFPVEAARVLAWHRGANGQTPAVAEITYEVSTTAEREAVWKIRWLDEAKKPIREKEVRYAEKQLVAGPDYYRGVFAQLASDNWAISATSPDNAATAFWQGAELSGATRHDGIKAANTLLQGKPKMARPADASRMAGILSHACLPLIGNQLSIDPALLARGAAWLCAAETMSREKFDAAWVPFLFLSGREKSAGELLAGAPQRDPAKQTAAERFWALLVKRPPARDMFLFAAGSKNRTFAMPMMSYPSGLDSFWCRTTIDVAGDILGDRTLERMCEYMPALVMRGGVGAGHFASDAPEAFLRRWEMALTEFQPTTRDFTGYRDLSKNAPKPEQAAYSQVRRLAPVLNLGLDEGVGALIPTAHLTARDLLNYGWEMTCLQFGYQYDFLSRRLGDPDAARQLADAVLGSIKGADAFVIGSNSNVLAPFSDYARVQQIGSSRIHEALAKKLPNDWNASPDTYLRRIWLNHTGVRDAVESMITANAGDQVFKENVERLIRESGPMALHGISYKEKQFKHPETIDRVGLRDAINAEEPWSMSLQSARVWSESGAKGDIVKYAQDLEKLSWEFGAAVSDSIVFLAYLQTNDIDSAKRYYDQIVPFVTEGVGFSNTTGPQRFALAWWEKDDAGMRKAMKDSSTYSWSDLNIQCAYAVHSGDLPAAEQIINAMIERYSNPKGRDSNMKSYFALVPALKDPQHADHGKALDSFPQSASWQFVQWILLKQANLNADEAVRFLGGDKAPPENAPLIAYLRGNKNGFAAEFSKVRWKEKDEKGALLALLRNELLEIQPPGEQPDLKPANAKPLIKQIGDALNASTSADVAETVDFTKYKTAEDFWAAVEKLREMPRRSADSPEDRMRQIRGWLEQRRSAADAFLKAHPNDPHRHAARLISIDSTLQLARFGEKDIAKIDGNELDAIANAADADDATKGEAAFFKLMVDSNGVDFNSPHTVPPFQQGLATYLEKYPKHERTPYVASMLMQVLSQVETPSTEPLLKKLATNPNEQIAQQAKATLQQRQFMLDLKKKPLVLKFAAIDGTEVDVAKLRGKVVLLDFWASWCGPCMADAPKVVETYKKLRERGFEIIGISLDQDKEAMESALKKMDMTWPQHFDGKGWQNEIAQSFGIRSIPSTWLFDKKGKLREHGLRGPELEIRIENLLKEK